jgi:hypothetical protein
MIVNPGSPEDVFNATSVASRLAFSTSSFGDPAKSFVLVFISFRGNSQADHEIHNCSEFITPPQAFVKRNLT